MAKSNQKQTTKAKVAPAPKSKVDPAAEAAAATAAAEDAAIAEAAATKQAADEAAAEAAALAEVEVAAAAKKAKAKIVEPTDALVLRACNFGEVGAVVTLSKVDAKSGEECGMLDLSKDAIAAYK